VLLDLRTVFTTQDGAIEKALATIGRNG
jgi:hypothetical protein